MVLQIDRFLTHVIKISPLRRPVVLFLVRIIEEAVVFVQTELRAGEHELVCVLEILFSTVYVIKNSN